MHMAAHERARVASAKVRRVATADGGTVYSGTVYSCCADCRRR